MPFDSPKPDEETGVEEKARKPQRRKRARLIRIIVVLAILAALAGGAWLKFGRSAAAPNFIAVPVMRGTVEETVLATGVLEPARLVSVGSQVSGRIEKLHVAVGDVVATGDLIAEIDSTTQANAVQTAEAGLENMRAQRAASAARLLEAERTFERRFGLRESEAVSDADVESAEAELASARAQVAALDAQIETAEIAVATARANLDYTRIAAPMDGTIVAVIVEEGQTVAAIQAAPTIVKLAQLDTMTVNAEISEADITRVREGQTVYFTTLGSQQRYYAELRRIEPTPRDMETQDNIRASEGRAIYYNALFDVPNPEGVLRTWMTVQVYIVLEKAENVPVVPAAALGMQRPDGRFMVRVLGESGEPEERWVAIGVNDAVRAQILDGLEEGARVVTADASGPSAAIPRNFPGPPGGMMRGPPPGGGRGGPPPGAFP